MREKKSIQLWEMALYGFNAVVWTLFFVLDLIFNDFDLNGLSVLRGIAAVLWCAAFFRMLFLRRKRNTQAECPWES